ncbi:hypothetical protein KIN_40570 [Litoreibacter roseus]|uniref:Uncharacterized protein n=1 Tax=Litoreibacter roseus TaxID=2601869 RepID=A0A6N6JKX8_9RHOB|nr:hypothetical protein KIN_40570 [Litoreibacter roseus]
MLGINRVCSTLIVDCLMMTEAAFDTSFILEEKADIGWRRKGASEYRL